MARLDTRHTCAKVYLEAKSEYDSLEIANLHLRDLLI